jgi:hypothetical protein
VYMQKITLIFFLLQIIMCNTKVLAQEKDTFFLAKKRGLLGKLGKSISASPPSTKPMKVVNPFLQYKGKIIRNIEFLPLGFDTNIYDTTLVKNNFGVRVANTFHKNTRKKILQNNLFFKEGDIIYPLLLADNERHLRGVPFLQDARIIIDEIPRSKDSVDILVITRDVFSIGGNIDVSSAKRGELELREENFQGSGTKISFAGLYDKERTPMYGMGGEIKGRNINGSFIDFSVGFRNFKDAYNSGRKEETTIYTRIEKPLVSAYVASTGAIEAAFNKTANNYQLTDSLYKSDYHYTYFNIDGWYAYSFGGKNLSPSNKETRIRSFFALRGFHQKYYRIPDIFDGKADYRYVNMTGYLTSINIFKQNFYKTNFVYGFGIYEDVPDGFSVSLTSGWSNKNKRKRPYAGIDFLFTHYNKKGFYSTYTFRTGGNFYKKRFEDYELLFNVDHFTKLNRLNAKWFNRNFFGFGFTTQINPFINTPLFLNSVYGLPYFSNGYITGDLRATGRAESVFYGISKILGFRFAPFVFTDASLIKPVKQNFNKTDLYTALGGGIRSRNENLVFGTMELRGYYFPRTNPGVKSWKIEFATGLRFRFFSQFIKKPDFVVLN